MTKKFLLKKIDFFHKISKFLVEKDFQAFNSVFQQATNICHFHFSKLDFFFMKEL